MNKTKYLSPSTQEKNIGVGNYGTEEKRMNQVADVTEKVLKQHGFVVYRNKPEMTLAQVVADSNGKKPDIHFAIHSNAGSGNNRGCEVYCHKFGGSGEKLVRAVYSEIEPNTPSRDRGVKEGCNHYGKGKPLYELEYTAAPAALIEIAYHDNKDDAVWIINNIEVIGTVIAKGILKYFDIPFQKENLSLENDINILNKLGIIASPDYWKENAVKGKNVNGEYVATLMKRAADMLSK